MTLKKLHSPDKAVSASLLFKGEEGKATTIQILKGAILKEHITKIPALLVCISGQVRFENEQDSVVDLSPGDYVNIEPMVKHWLVASEDSQLVLLK